MDELQLQQIDAPSTMRDHRIAPIAPSAQPIQCINAPSDHIPYHSTNSTVSTIAPTNCTLQLHPLTAPTVPSAPTHQLIAAPSTSINQRTASNSSSTSYYLHQLTAPTRHIDGIINLYTPYVVRRSVALFRFVAFRFVFEQRMSAFGVRRSSFVVVHSSAMTMTMTMTMTVSCCCCR